jgi:hypothetical protein
MTTPVPLEDGTAIRYAMGLGVDDWGGRRVIAHGGGINGFLSDGRYYPDEDLIIVVLQNSTGPQGPGELGAALAELVLGPLPEPGAAQYEGDLDELLGTYAGPARGQSLTLVVTRTGDGLVFTPEGAEEGTEPVYVDGSRWRDGDSWFWFVRDEDGIAGLRVDQVYGHYVLERVGA